MSPGHWIGLITLGALTGVLSGLVGIGGGIVMVPALVFIFGFTQHEAQGTTLGAMLLPVGLLAVHQYYKRGQVDLAAAVLISAGFFIGGFWGGKLAGLVSKVWLARGFGMFMIFAGLRLVLAGFR